MHCCDRHTDSGFVLEQYLPGPLHTNSPPPDSLTADTTPTTVTKEARPRGEQKKLKERLQLWVRSAHEDDHLRAVRPRDYILSAADIKVVARAPSTQLDSATMLTTILLQTSDWEREWSQKIFAVIEDFEAEILATAKPKSKRSRPAITSSEFVDENSDGDAESTAKFFAKEAERCAKQRIEVAAGRAVFVDVTNRYNR
jgi:hypothetical protein